MYITYINVKTAVERGGVSTQNALLVEPLPTIDLETFPKIP